MRERRHRCVMWVVILGGLVVLAVDPEVVSGAAEAPAAESNFRIPEPSRSVLKNGLTLLVLERRSVPLVQFRLLLEAGVIHEPRGKGGIAQLTSRLLKRGTASRSARQFAEEVEFVGGLLEAQAGLETTTLVSEFASTDLPLAFDLLADMVVNPAFRDAEFGKEKGLLLADLVALLDDPGRLASEAFTSWLYGTHPYGRPLLGTRHSVEALTREDVIAFHRARFTPDGALLAIIGDVDTAGAREMAERHFAGWGRRAAARINLPEPTPVRGRKILLVDKPDATQSQIRFGNLAVRRDHRHRIALTVANAILGEGFTSWLMDTVRVKRGLTYSIRSSIPAGREAGAFVVSTFTKNETVAETIQVSLGLIDRLRSGSVPEEDLSRARNYLAGSFPLDIESPEDLAAELLNVEFYGLGRDYLSRYQARIRGTDLRSVRRAAKRHLPLDDLAIVVVGPAAELREPLGELGQVTVRPLESATGASS